MLPAPLIPIALAVRRLKGPPNWTGYRVADLTSCLRRGADSYLVEWQCLLGEEVCLIGLVMADSDC